MLNYIARLYVNNFVDLLTLLGRNLTHKQRLGGNSKKTY